jgi:hypothetical protein
MVGFPDGLLFCYSSRDGECAYDFLADFGGRTPARHHGNLLLRFRADAAQYRQGPAGTAQDGEDGQRRQVHMSNPVAPAGVAHLYQGYEPKLLTAADLAALPSELPSGTVLYGLHHGVLVTMPPPETFTALSSRT